MLRLNQPLAYLAGGLAGALGLYAWHSLGWGLVGMLGIAGATVVAIIPVEVVAWLRGRYAVADLGDHSDFDAPRGQHYLFAHRLLPSALFEAPEPLRRALGSSKQLLFLRKAWRRAGLGLARRELAQPTGLGAETRVAAGVGEVVIVRLPEPRAGAEAFYVALVFPSSGSSAPAYWTLELGGPGGWTVLGGWTADSQHLNHGRGPSEGPEAFRAEVVHRSDPRATSRSGG